MSNQEILEKYNRETAAGILGCEPHELSYFSFPFMFGSTAGPFGGIGGASMTSFQLEAFVNDSTQEACLFCGPRMWKKVYNFARPQFDWKPAKPKGV